MKRNFAVIIDWGNVYPGYIELVRGPFTHAEAEEVAREARRLGAKDASVHSVTIATRFMEQVNAS